MTIPFFNRLYKASFSSLRTPKGGTAQGKSCFLDCFVGATPLLAMTLKKVSQGMSLGLFLTISLHAHSVEQELKNCKSSLLAQLNEQKRLETKGCPVSEKLMIWLGILRDPDQFTSQELLSFLNTYSHWPHYEKLCEKAEDVIHKKASSAEILAWFEAHPPQTAEGALVYAQTLLSAEEKTKARKVIVGAWRSMELTKAEEKKFLSTFGSFLHEKDHVARLHFLLWNEDIDAAKRHLSRLSMAPRKVAHVRIDFLEKKPGALEKFRALPAKLQNEEGLLYEQAKWQRQQKAFPDALQTLLKASISHAHAQKWWKEQNYIARELIASGDYKTACKLIQKHKLVPGTEDYANAEWLAGWLSLRFLDKPKEAHRHFKALFSNVEGAVSKVRAAYWMGRTFEKSGQKDLAAAWYKKAARYKTIYYGQLAAAKLQEKPYPSLSPHPKATQAEKKRFEQKDLVKAARILKELGSAADHELRKFLLHIADQAKTRANRELAVCLAHTLSPHDVVWAAKKAGYKEPVLLQKAYPVYSIPQKGEQTPEKALILAIAYQESRFNPTAQSSAGAIGLLQLLPTTAALEAKHLGIKHSEKKLYEPKHNLLLGSAHLSRMLNNFDTSYILTLAAYNAGPTPVKRWLASFGDPRTGEIDVVDWIELIPYAETRNYVMRVLENITSYRALEGTPQKTLIHDLQR